MEKKNVAVLLPPGWETEAVLPTSTEAAADRQRTDGPHRASQEAVVVSVHVKPPRGQQHTRSALQAKHSGTTPLVTLSKNLETHLATRTG